MNAGIVSTIGQKCKRCYSCVRECPAKAIRVFGGQALVLSNRCISCGHCVKVCSLEAKQISSDLDIVMESFIPNNNTIAIVAPSFVASYPDNYYKIPNALKSLGFSEVIEAAFGADLVSKHYEKYIDENSGKVLISSPCPAIYNFIEKYYENLVDNLVEIVSPMIAMGRYLKNKYGSETKVVFIGPCVAKKSEYKDPEVDDAIDAVFTFTELKKLFNDYSVDLKTFDDSLFDPPYANLGKSYPLSGGLLKTANINNDVLAKDVIVVDGKNKVEELIKDISTNKIKSKFVDILFCEGCISGPAIESNLNYYSRREKVIEYIDKNITYVDKNVWKSELYNNRNLNLTRSFKNRSQRIQQPSEERIKEILASSNKFTKQDELNCGSCGYSTCREYAISIAKGIAEEEMCLPNLIDKMENAYTILKDTQEQLHNAEKLASIGQLAAGVAHEINNPLGTILLYASMLKDDISNLKVEFENSDDIKMIIEETKRCKNIVSNLLNFARQGNLKIQNENIANLVKDIIKLIILKKEFNSINIKLTSELTEKLFPIDLDQIKQVLLNLITNACEALAEVDKKVITIKLYNNETKLFIEIEDFGDGIKNENMNRLFVPFFTTKKIGRGTGLGLAISYGIVKMHKGKIIVKSSVGNGSTFTVVIPILK